MNLDYRHALLSNAQAYRADSLAEAAGIDSFTLMENAGRGIAGAVVKALEPCHVAVLAGPGNNGGDGYVAARHLTEAGFEVVVYQLGSPGSLTGDAKRAAEAWDGAVRDLAGNTFAEADCIVDALFGAGLSRGPEGAAAVAVKAANRSPAYRVAVDVPSGIVGDSGTELGEAFGADLTVTFFRKKPGLLLMPGLERCGRVEVVDIGIPETALEEIAPRIFENHPDHWRDLMPGPARHLHKYKRGHLGVVGGAAPLSGAARLAARAGLRTGAGLVTTMVPEEALAIYAAHQTSVMTRPFSSEDDFEEMVESGKFSGFLIGPGNGVNRETRRRCQRLLETGKPVLVDADAITAFEEKRESLLEDLHGHCVLTPHDGEFSRLWPDIDPAAERVEAAKTAAAEAGAVILLKGPDTVIAAPDGRVLISALGPPHLATAGAGDVLGGMVAGLMAAGMEALAAAAAGSWLHSSAANLFGPGMISEDLVDAIPAALAGLSPPG